MVQQIKIYAAAKKKHAEKLLKFFRAQEGFHLCARWLETASLDVNKNRPAPHWQHENFDDIVSSHFCILYAELGDHLVISIGEMFYAMAYGKPIYVIGQRVDNAEDMGVPGVVYHPDYDDWTANPARVRRVGSLEEAIADIRARVAREGLK